jgi:cell division protein FtsQ
MPLEMADPDEDDSPRIGGARFGRQRFEEPRGAWWRPVSTVGRVFLGLGILIVLGGLATAGSLLKTSIGRDARFRIAGAGNIEASGLTEVSRAEMLPVFGEDIGRNIFFVPLAERRRQLEEIPWVERATVMRLLPDRIRIEVVERQPVAFTRQGQQIGLVDASGVLLTMPAEMMAQHHYSFPVVTGIDPRDPLLSRKARMAVYLHLLAELDGNNQHLSEQISEIDLTDPEDARVLMPEQGADILAHFGEDRFLERYQRYKAHIAEWRQQYPKLSAVDLRYDQQAVLEMTHNSNVPDAPAAVSGAAADASDGRTPAAEPAGKAEAEPKPGLPGKLKPPASQPAAKISGGKGTAKVPGDGSAKATVTPAKDKTAPDKAARDKAARDKAAKDRAASKDKTARKAAAKSKAARSRKRAEAQRAALNLKKRKAVPPTRPAASAAEGQ